MSYRVPERIYRTKDGRLVRHGDPEAAFLAFPEGEELSDEEAKRFGLLEFEKKNRAPQPEEKQAAQPEDKQAAKPEDKSATRSAASRGAKTEQ